jgi:hypothetical protein
MWSSDKLPATYGGHNNSNNLKSFSVRMTRGEHNCFVVIAIANLGFPKSLARDFDIVLEDKFIEIASNVGALDVMEQLQGEAKRRNEKGKKASLFMAATAST